MYESRERRIEGRKKEMRVEKSRSRKNERKSNERGYVVKKTRAKKIKEIEEETGSDRKMEGKKGK